MSHGLETVITLCGELFEELIEEHPDAETPIDDEQRVLLENILNLRDRTISDVMVPRADIVAINVKAQLEDIIELINDQAHSRVPVFQETLDDAIGMVHIKDVLAAQQRGNGFGLRGIIRSVLLLLRPCRSWSYFWKCV